MIDLHLNDILNKTTKDSSFDTNMQSVTSERIPDDLFIGTESLYISEEGIISNIIDWFRKKQKEREERRRAQQKQEWQSGINSVFEGYYDWLGSLDPKRLASKEIDAYKYEGILSLVQAITKATQGFLNLDPLKYTSLVKLIAAIRSNLAGQKNFYLDESDDLTFEVNVARPATKFKSSKWSSEQAVKRLQSQVIQMDELGWKLDDMAIRIVNEYNTKLRKSDDREMRDVRKCAVCWLNFTDLVSNQEITTVKAICSTLNNM